jgi:hypothetical protein
MLIGGWGRRRIQARLEAGRDPGKQKLKGAVRTEIYWRHYCQQLSLLELLHQLFFVMGFLTQGLLNYLHGVGFKP